MTTPVATVPASESLADAAERIVAHWIGSVVVVEDGNPVGIVTETDVLLAGHRTGRPFANIRISAAASRPLITIAPDAPVRAAVADTRGVELEDVEGTLADLCSGMAVTSHESSMLQDVEAGRKTEIDDVNGANVRIGREAGVEVPLNEAVTALVRGLERGYLDGE